MFGVMGPHGRGSVARLRCYIQYNIFVVISLSCDRLLMEGRVDAVISLLSYQRHSVHARDRLNVLENHAANCGGESNVKYGTSR